MEPDKTSKSPKHYTNIAQEHLLSSPDKKIVSLFLIFFLYINKCPLQRKCTPENKGNQNILALLRCKRVFQLSMICRKTSYMFLINYYNYYSLGVQMKNVHVKH